MGAFNFQTQSNETPGSFYDVLGVPMPARAFFFTVVDEVGQNGFLVRKIYATPYSPYLSKMDLSPLRQLGELYPEQYGIFPKGWGQSTSVAEHVMGNNISPFVSTSSIFPGGSPRFDGRNVFIDVAKAKASGARLVSTQEILTSLQQYKAAHPHLGSRVEKISEYVRSIDKEVLVHGEKVPASAVFNQSSLRSVLAIRSAGRVRLVVGVPLWQGSNSVVWRGLH